MNRALVDPCRAMRYQALTSPGFLQFNTQTSRSQTTTDAVRARIIALHDSTHPARRWAGNTPTKKCPRSSYIRFQAELPNGCWQADIPYWFLVDATRVEILDFLDDHSRLLLTIQAKVLWTSADVVAVMDRLWATGRHTDR